MKITMNSKIKDVYENPIGHDILKKVLMQVGLNDSFINNILVSNLTLKRIKPLTKKVLDDGFWDALLVLVNMDTGEEAPLNTPLTKKWWKESVFYQIYPRTFCDSNGDGIGDIQGIISKLDYLKELGVDALWLSPIYDSPMADNGYDIRDYRAINPDFGTMEDFDQLLKEVHQRDMRLIMDLVVNHTSDEHPWFQSAISDENSQYRDYYFIRDKDHLNNWTSFFSGLAWDEYTKDTYALHLFAKKQPDLNWDNPNVRSDVADMVNWWLEKGVDGFRLDVINYISKEEGLPQGNESVGNLMGYTGIEHYYYGPHLHEYLHELHENAFAKHDAFSVGETPGLGLKMSRRVTGEERKELDMVFSFDHLETPGHVRWDDYRYDLNYFRDYMIEWMNEYGNNCWMSLFYNNHDNPRMVSKIDPTGTYRKEIEELLCVMQMSLKGTPFIYQGDEMGLTNYPFRSIDEMNDIESINYYKQLQDEGKTKDEAWNTILAGSRDHVRLPLPWNENAKQEVDLDITNIYQEMIKLRRSEKVLLYGDFIVLNKKKNRFVYERKDENTSIIVDCNLSHKTVQPYSLDDSYELIWPKVLKGTSLHPYGVRIWKRSLR